MSTGGSKRSTWQSYNTTGRAPGIPEGAVQGILTRCHPSHRHGSPHRGIGDFFFKVRSFISTVFGANRVTSIRMWLFTMHRWSLSMWRSCLCHWGVAGGSNQATLSPFSNRMAWSALWAIHVTHRQHTGPDIHPEHITGRPCNPSAMCWPWFTQSAPLDPRRKEKSCTCSNVYCRSSSLWDSQYIDYAVQCAGFGLHKKLWFWLGS
jgi:hypothetical protein